MMAGGLDGYIIILNLCLREVMALARLLRFQVMDQMLI